MMSGGGSSDVGQSGIVSVVLCTVINLELCCAAALAQERAGGRHGCDASVLRIAEQSRPQP